METAGAPASGPAQRLDAERAMTDNFRKSYEEVVALEAEAREVEELRESLDRLRLEVTELQASRERLVRAADADRRKIERELHDGPQQDLVGLAVNLQHARRLVDVDPAAAGVLLDEMRGDVREALDALRALAHRIHPPLLGAGGLRTALRSAAAAAGVATRVRVAEGTALPPQLAATVYSCCVATFEQVGAGTRSTITVREEDGMLAFEIVTNGSNSASADDLGPIRDRVEALGGRLTIESEPGQPFRISGSLPISP
jgi:signal transduction histidine kinase